eukprot:XP_005250561.1 solute carrier family 12 member 9 isoform X6 [Homo sapiens]
MSSLIGASRILHALARDDLFGVILAPAKVVSRGGNPWAAVLYSWGLVQLVLLAGKLNTLAAVVTVFYLVAYAAVDLSCLSLEWASAPNFRPTFSLFSWHTCLLGVASCLLMMFLISPGAAGGSLLLMGLLAALLTARGGPSSWGYVSQALLFHQVRKYLLRLDVRKDHVKFWRPQLLLLVGNPRGALPLLRLANQLKKGGLYVLGHVTLGDLDSLPSDPVQPQYGAWLSLVDRAQVKAFVDLTLSPSVRQGAQHLLRISGLGGMKPNTLVLGFYDDAPPQDHFLTDPAFSEPADSTREGSSPALSTLFPPPRAPGSPRALNPQDYVATVADALKMNKNVVLARASGALPPERLSRGSGGTSQLHHVDVWPLNLLRPRGGPGYVDVCGLFLLQMATILGMVPAWHSARLRIFLCLGPREAPGAAEGRLRALLSQLRIRAEVQEVVWGEGAGAGEPEAEEEGDFVNSGRGDAEAEALARSANALVRAQQGRGTGGGPGGPEGGDAEGPITALTFLYLPRPPADPARYPRYLALLETLTRDLGPTLLVHGVTPVTCTDL